MKYLFDTDHASFLQGASGTEYERIVARLNQLDDDDTAISIVSLHEQALGCHKRINRAKRVEDLVAGYDLLTKVLNAYCLATILEYDRAAAEMFAGLRQQKVRIGTMDLRIASIALVNGLVVVTRNSRDYSQVPGLAIEDWTT